MLTINKPAMQWGYLLAACILGLTGCAHDGTMNDGTTSINPFTGRAVAGTVYKDGVQQKLRIDNALALLAEKDPDYATMNPVPITFEKLTVKLDEHNRHIVEQISERAKKAPKLVLTGYCDYRQIGNAKAAAIARATAIRNELVHLGVSAKKIRIKHVTDVAGKHAADIEF